VEVALVATEVQFGVRVCERRRGEEEGRIGVAEVLGLGSSRGTIPEIDSLRGRVEVG